MSSVPLPPASLDNSNFAELAKLILSIEAVKSSCFCIEVDNTTHVVISKSIEDIALIRPIPLNYISMS